MEERTSSQFQLSTNKNKLFSVITSTKIESGLHRILYWVEGSLKSLKFIELLLSWTLHQALYILCWQSQCYDSIKEPGSNEVE